MKNKTVPNVLYTYRCPCRHRGEIRLKDDSHDGETVDCSACGATVRIEFDGGVTFEVARDVRAKVA
jgi:predicted SprT family Zn-dependent metalloprotease